MGKGRCVGLRREDMYDWERRTPLIPEHIQALQASTDHSFYVQTSKMRAYADSEYSECGLPVVETLENCPVIIALKEIPVDVLEAEKTYVYFSHVIKGQTYNMPMLQRALDLGITIIDYERIVNEDNCRLIAFGNYAGLAGMIDSLWSLGSRLTSEGIENPFATLRQASDYDDLADAKTAIRAVGERITAEGLPGSLCPLVVGIAGYGNVSKGAQEILDLLPVTEISAADLLANELPGDAAKTVFKIVFREEDTVLPLVEGKMFDLQEYYDFPERYRGAFERYLDQLTVLVNCIYWEPKYPRLVTKEAIQALFANGQPKLRVIGDISCDVEGGIEITVKATEPNDPVFVYDPSTGEIQSGVEGHGPVMMTVEILPTELPRESSAYFSNILKEYVPAIASADYKVDFDALDLPAPLKRAIICHRGELMPSYQYIQKYLTEAAENE